MAATKDFPGITPQTIARFREELAKRRIELPAGDEGTISHAGVRLSYQYDAARSVLQVRIDDKPFIVSEAFVWNLLSTALQSAST